MLTKSCEKVAKNFECKFCNYVTSRKSSFDKHILTRKHKMLTNANKSCKKVAANLRLHECSRCHRSYTHKSSLCRHQKSCNTNIALTDKEQLHK